MSDVRTSHAELVVYYVIYILSQCCTLKNIVYMCIQQMNILKGICRADSNQTDLYVPPALLCGPKCSSTLVSQASPL